MNLQQAIYIIEDSPAEETDAQQVRAAWQYLHDSRMAYQLQGFYGRTARRLVKEGVILP